MEVKRTLRERKFVKAYIKNNGNATQAYIDAFPNVKKESARQLGYRMLTNVDISVTELLDRLGATDAHIGSKIYEGMDATKVISVIPLKPKEGQENPTDLPDANSRNIEFVDVPDFNVRVKYIDIALKLKGKYPSEKHDVKFKGELKITDARQKLIDKVNSLTARTREGKTT